MSNKILNKAFSRFCNNPEPTAGGDVANNGDNGPINFNGHCIFCLVKLTPMNSSKSAYLKSTTHIWPYIQPNWKNGEELIFIQGKTLGGTAIKSKTPPMCATCSERCREISRLHNEVELIKKKLEEVAGEIQTTIGDSSSDGKCRFRTEKFLKSMKDAKVPEESIENAVQFLKRLQMGDPEPDVPVPVIKEKECKSCEDISVMPLRDPLAEEGENAIYAEGEVNTEPMETTNEDNASSSEERNSLRPPQENILSEEASSSKDEHRVNKRHYRLNNYFRYRGYCVTAPGALYSLKVPKLRLLGRRRKGEEKGKKFQNCTVCGLKISCEEIYEHTRSHVGDYAFKCPVPNCTYTALSKWKFVKDHVNSQNKCAKVFTTYRVKDHPNNKQCELCDQNFNQMTCFGQHLARHETSSMKKYECPIEGCKKRYALRQSVEVHLFLNHSFRQSRKFSHDYQNCQLCTSHLKTSKIRLHYATKHDITDVPQCPHCPVCHIDRAKLIDHLAQHGTNLLCDICDNDQTYDNITSIRLHYYTEHKIGTKFVCEICDDFCAFTMKDLKVHHTSMHWNRPMPSLRCFACQNPIPSFRSIHELNVHRAKCHGVEILKCTFCSKTFSARRNLLDHLKSHKNGVLVENCEKCEKTYFCGYPHICSRSKSNGKLSKTCGAVKNSKVKDDVEPAGDSHDAIMQSSTTATPTEVEEHTSDMNCDIKIEVKDEF